MNSNNINPDCATCDYQRQIESMTKRLENAKVFFGKVAQMRSAQINYFKTRASGYLEQSKQLEKQVDAIIESATETAKQLSITF